MMCFFVGLEGLIDVVGTGVKGLRVFACGGLFWGFLLCLFVP